MSKKVELKNETANGTKPVLSAVVFPQILEKWDTAISKCKSQCEHCKEYYAPMERIHKLRNQLQKIEKQLDNCRTSAMQDHRYCGERITQASSRSLFFVL